MRAAQKVLASLVLASALVLAAAVPAGADPVVCQDWPGGCCGEVTVLGKTVLRIDC